ncbi:NosD domain-containing protein [Tenacibaculum sp. M341]|uniref:NosD domain-containing protein n=1 Tax=Tenacibaculum sp. M341 TaxID=2530339 RepID=UPI0010517C2A|nr:right-handed parallel beta-helix repeat-containing protein [Tenacibaculum sp. M341]TCI92234.1 hypothetical protein EYW44_08615 [Tenacibaculum sp. M341]
MKKIAVNLAILGMMSCSKETTFSIGNDNTQDEAPTIILPCNFDAIDIKENATLEIDCSLDLKGETVSLPNNVNFNFNGGEITNGTLIFNGGTIAGELLNHTIDLEGDVQLQNTTFNFLTSKWDIVEGTTDSDTALENTAKLEKLFFFTKKLGADTFKINELDAFFEVTRVTSTTSNQNYYPSLEAVNLPSDFNLIMTSNTHLRIFPGGNYNKNSGAILAVRDAENITITGGNFYGDRNERIFSPDDTGTEGSHLIHIHSGRNIVVNGGNFQNGSSGTFAIYSFGFAFNPDYNPTENVTIKNCTIKNSRRMAIALVDGRNVTIENNTFIDTGQPNANTDGGEVGYAINIEPERFRDTNGDLQEYQRVFDVLIKNNTESGSRGGFLTITIGQDITVKGNDIGSRVVSSFVSGAKILDNNFKAVGSAQDSWAMFIAGSGETVFNNEIANNSIQGYSAGIIVGSIDAYVHHNNIKDCGAGIQLSQAKDARIHNNMIDVTKNGIQSTNTYCDNVEIKENTVTTTGNFNLYVANMNNLDDDKDKQMIIEANDFKNDKGIIFSRASGITFHKNSMTGGISFTNVDNSKMTENTIIPNESHGIKLDNVLNDVIVTDNIISIPTGTTGNYRCLYSDDAVLNNVTISNNSCN